MMRDDDARIERLLRSPLHLDRDHNDIARDADLDLRRQVTWGAVVSYTAGVVIAALIVMYVITMWLLDVSLARALAGFLVVVFAAVISAYVAEWMRFKK